ncbi:hypothetical protein PUR57_08085 [Streptomyces sp. JV176]|uniref:hypothetical protein n=1 Tax=Streptomyces sp. JV176 TaxID=858630 RepID=UPI002E789FD8|nr:hypothetical protein [Streptomyces sp. JV176]MEE1798633.1 hypothetical protein [Streptomyces sp. JV176]
MNLRMIGLSAAVVCAALVPLVASAGSLGPSLGSLGSLDSLGPEGGPGAASAPEPAAAPVAEDERPRTDATDSAARTDTWSRTDTESRTDIEARADAPVRTVELCGPEVVSPEGVEAQTCVLADGPAAGGDTWGRTYYRNATGRELLAVLSLMGPRGRTVQTHCAIAADDEPATCETPREPSRGKRSGYLAMAEFAAPGKSGSGAHEGPLLLRSGSNSPGPAAG